MTAVMDSILGVSAGLAYMLVFAFVFLEDAIFVGFILPGETAAILGGVLAGRGGASFWLMLAIVIVAATAGDTVGYEIGKHFGPRLLGSRLLRSRRKELERAQDLLLRRGGWAVFLGRFTAFFRAVMPALAGTSRLPYRRFVVFNALGGTVWASIYVSLGFFACNAYQVIAQQLGTVLAIVMIAVAATITILVVRRRRKHRRQEQQASGRTAAIFAMSEGQTPRR